MWKKSGLGDEFNDKESFVTSAYKKKLEELKKLEEEEKREEYLESIGDVRKQGNLDGFYRHLYEQKVNYSDKKDSNETETKQEESTLSTQNSEGNISEKNEEEAKDDLKAPKRKPNRRYRKRGASESDEEKLEEEEKKLEHLPSNIDADSDFSIDSDSENSGDESKPKKMKTEDKIEEDSTKSCEKSTVIPSNGDSEGVDGKIKIEKSEETKEKEEIKPKKPKIDIWKKRTVGKVFDEALQRYFERKALREAAK